MEEQEVPLDKSPALEGCQKSSPDGAKKSYVLGVVNASEIKCTVARKRRWDQPPDESPQDKKPCLDLEDDLTNIPVPSHILNNLHNSIQHSISSTPNDIALKSQDQFLEEDITDNDIIVKEQIIVQTPSEILNQLDLNPSGINELNYVDGSRQVTIEIETVEVTPAEDVLCDDMPKTSVDKNESDKPVVNHVKEYVDFSSDSITGSTELDSVSPKKMEEKCSVVDVPLVQEESDDTDQESIEQKSIVVDSAGNVDPSVIEVILGIKNDSSKETPSSNNINNDTEEKDLFVKDSPLSVAEKVSPLGDVAQGLETEETSAQSPDQIPDPSAEFRNEESSNDSSSVLSAPRNCIKLVDYELSNDKTDLTDSNLSGDLSSPVQVAKEIEPAEGFGPVKSQFKIDLVESEECSVNFKPESETSDGPSSLKENTKVGAFSSVFSPTLETENSALLKTPDVSPGVAVEQLHELSQKKEENLSETNSFKDISLSKSDEAVIEHTKENNADCGTVKSFGTIMLSELEVTPSNDSIKITEGCIVGKIEDEQIGKTANISEGSETEENKPLEDKDVNSCHAAVVQNSQDLNKNLSSNVEEGDSLKDTDSSQGGALCSQVARDQELPVSQLSDSYPKSLECAEEIRENKTVLDQSDSSKANSENNSCNVIEACGDSEQICDDSESNKQNEMSKKGTDVTAQEIVTVSSKAETSNLVGQSLNEDKPEELTENMIVDNSESCIDQEPSTLEDELLDSNIEPVEPAHDDTITLESQVPPPVSKHKEDALSDLMECDSDDESDSSMIEVPSNSIPSTEVSQDRFPDVHKKDIVINISDSKEDNSNLDCTSVLSSVTNNQDLLRKSEDTKENSGVKGSVLPEEDSSNVEMIDDSPIPSVETGVLKTDSIVGSGSVPPSPVCLSSDHQDSKVDSDSNSLLMSYIDVQSEVVIVPDSDSESVQCVEQNSTEVININSSSSVPDTLKNDVLKESTSEGSRLNFSLKDSEKGPSFLSQSESAKINDKIDSNLEPASQVENIETSNKSSMPLKGGNVAMPPKLEPITLRIFKDNHSLHSERSRSPKSNERGSSSPVLKGSPNSPQSKQLEFTLRISKDANTNIPKATMSPKGSPGSVWKMSDSKKNDPLPDITISNRNPDAKVNLNLQAKVWDPEVIEVDSGTKSDNDSCAAGVVNSDNRVSSVNSSLDFSEKMRLDVKACINDNSSDIYFSDRAHPSAESVHRLDDSSSLLRDPHPTPMLKRRGRPRKTLLAQALEAVSPDTPPTPIINSADLLSDPNAASRPMRECRDRTKPIVVKTRRPRGSSLRGSIRGVGGRGGHRVPSVPNIETLTPREREELAKIEARAEQMREEKLAKRDAKLAKKALKLASCEPIILSDEQREELSRRTTADDDFEETPETLRLKEEVLKASAEAAAAREAEMEAIRVAKEEEKAAKVAARRAKLLSDYKAKRDAKLAKKLAKKLKDEERRKRKAAEKLAERAALQNMYEDETRMSAGDFRHFPGEESQSSNCGVTPTKRGGGRMEISIDPDSKDLGVEQLAEYQWEGSELFMIQEQVAEYLGVKSFKRKYPDLKRRPVEAEERKFLEESGLVPKTMCDLGITAVPSAEVLDIMYQDFPEKYEEVRRYLREKQMREISTKQKALYMLSKQNEKAKADLREQALENAALWNSQLNRERREDRICSMDLQSMIIHYPASKRDAMLSRVQVESPGNYPVAVLPGQFCDYYKKYTSAELMYYPMNTVLYGPLKPNERHVHDSENSQSESEDTSSSDDSSGSSSSDSDSETEEENAKCKLCSIQKKLNKEGQQEKFIQCTKCKLLCHLSCCNLVPQMIPHVRKYQWKCPSCKVCLKCNNPSNQDKVITCDLCHRGFHTYCMGVKKVADKRWHCSVCSYCWSCGSKESGNTDWIHEFTKDEKGGKNYIRTLCSSCSSGPLTSGTSQSFVVTPKGTQVFFKDSKQQLVIREEGSKASTTASPMKSNIVITPNKRLEIVSHVTSVVNGAMKNFIIRK